MSKPLADPRAARAAALAAAEARLRGDPSSSSSSSSPPKPVMPAWQPSEKSDAEKRKEFTRLLYRGIVRDNGYKQASECLETLVKITKNILDKPDEGKYRELRAANGTIKGKILDVIGGHEYLIALGFRTRTVNFEKQYLLEPTFKRIHELKLGYEVLSEALPEVQSRVTSLSSSTTLHSADEAARRARALAEYEADRDLVKQRVKREKIAREAKEAAAAAKAAQQATEGDEVPVQEEREEDDSGGLAREDYKAISHPDGEDGEDEEGEEVDDEYGDFRRSGRGKWGAGNRLGGS